MKKRLTDKVSSCGVFPRQQIWVRNYQIVQEAPANAKQAKELKATEGNTSSTSTSLVEIGPRFVLNPIRIFRGAFGGQTLFQNPDYVSPNEIRAANKRSKGMAYVDRKESQLQRKEREENIMLPEDPLADVFD